MSDETFTIDDFVEIICHDGATFAGFLVGFTEQYVVLNGPRAFPCTGIRVMTHG